MSPGCVGRHPSRSSVNLLDVGLSIETKGPRKPKWLADLPTAQDRQSQPKYPERMLLLTLQM